MSMGGNTPMDYNHGQDWRPDLIPNTYANDEKNYALSGKIMLGAIVILLFVVILMVVLHLYARWYLHRARRRHSHLRRSRRPSPTLVFRSVSDTSDPRGLDPEVIKSLPVFVFKHETHPDPVDCAVCLSEFEEKESGRILPNCNHSFHTQCIDMWFHSHSTCPLCRAPVELPKNPTRVVVEILGASSSSGSQEGHVAGPSGSKKPVGFVGITVEVPLRGANTGFGSESGTAESTPSQFRSPVGRMLSRILSRERRPVTPTSCGDDVADVDLERGELTRG